MKPIGYTDWSKYKSKQKEKNMSEFKPNPGSGFIFSNTKDQNNGKQPDFKGQITTPSGEVLDIALWFRDGNKGRYLSAKVSEPYKQNTEPAKTDQTSPEYKNNDSNDGLPF